MLGFQDWLYSFQLPDQSRVPGRLQNWVSAVLTTPGQNHQALKNNSSPNPFSSLNPSFIALN
jgi:hypothetical protein